MLPKLSQLRLCRNALGRQTRTLLTKNAPSFRADRGASYEPATCFALYRKNYYYFCRPNAATSSLFRPSSRSLLVSSPPPEGAPADEEVQWTHVYRFNYIDPVRAVSRLKLLQTALTIYLVPVVGYTCFVTESQPVSLFYQVIGMTTFAACMLFAFTRISQRTVMMMYVNPDYDRVRVSHLTFWGFRKESYFNASDFVPMGSDSNQDWNNTYVRLRMESGNFLYFAPRFGRGDSDVLQNLFS